MHILIDYRPALRQRTGVGEYVHRLSEAMLPQLAPGERLTLFSSSWKDRLRDTPPGAGRMDLRIPVAALNMAWHRLAWPPVERFGIRPDVTWSLHPLQMPSGHALRAVTVHDLYFLDRPEDTAREIRRDYPALAARHAAGADVVVVNSAYTRDQAVARLGVSPERIVICSPGALAREARPEPASAGPILHIGTIEPRKNVRTLIEAYRLLAAERPGLPPLIFAGQVRGSRPDTTGLPADAVQFPGYISETDKARLLASASMLVIPSVEEGFGMTAVEAMATGVPVIAAERGALPEVLDGAGLLIDPASPAAVASAIARVLDTEVLRRELCARGIQRAAAFRWDASASALLAAFRAAYQRRSRAA